MTALCRIEKLRESNGVRLFERFRTFEKVIRFERRRALVRSWRVVRNRSHRRIASTCTLLRQCGLPADPTERDSCGVSAYYPRSSMPHLTLRMGRAYFHVTHRLSGARNFCSSYAPSVTDTPVQTLLVCRLNFWNFVELKMGTGEEKTGYANCINT